MKILFPLLFCSLWTNAQITHPPVVYHSAIHLNPLALAQIDYTFLTGMEYRVRPKITIVGEAGYIFASDYISQKEKKQAHGFIFRPSARFFVTDHKNFYLQPQFFYKSVTHQLYDWIGMMCVNGVPAFEELKQFKYRRQIFGFNATAGVLVPLSRSARSFIDFYLGLGTRSKSAKLVKEPGSCYTRKGVFGNEKNDTGTFPNLPAGIKLIFVIH